MNIKFAMLTVMALGALAGRAAFDEAERAAVRKCISQTEAQLKSSATFAEKAITLLPVKGDQDGYCERLLIGALVKAGKTCVVSNDENNDERFKRIFREIKWDERQVTLKSIDAKTADELGKLKSTQVLLEARLDLVRRGRKRRAVAELNLLAYAVETKEYVWSANIAVDDTGCKWPDVSEVNVKVAFKAEENAGNVAAIVGSAVRDGIARYGYKVNADGKADLDLTATFVRKTFDRSGEYLVLKGTVQARLKAAADSGVLYEKVFSVKGKRGLGEEEAVRNLADEIAAEMQLWLKETIEPNVLFAKHPDFADQIGG